MISWITVVIPVYNRVFELERCLKSLENQSIKDFRVIVCDDGSDNRSQIETLVKNFSEKLDISCISIKNTGGPSSPRNKGISKCSTDWIAFLDSDDTWSKYKLEMTKNYINDYDFIYHKMSVINNFTRTNKSIGEKYHKGYLPLQIMTIGNKIPTSSVVIKKTILKNIKFDENKNIVSYEDVDLWVRLFQDKRIKIKFIKKELGCYYVSEDSISRISIKQVKLYLNFYKKNKNSFNQNEIKIINNYKNYILGVIFFRLNKNKLAIKYLFKAKYLESFKDNLKKYIKIIILIFRIILK